MEQLPFWNHNGAYYPWVREKLGQRLRILDVGCGEGTLVRYLSGGERQVMGLDPAPHCIQRAREQAGADSGIQYLQNSFEEWEGTPESWDGVVFVASLHHMDAEKAVDKAKGLLCKGGMLLVVGLAAPSNAADWLVECGRVVPAWIGSRLHHMETSEELGVPTSYALPGMAQVRRLVREQLPGGELRYGLYYRYLLFWTK